ncbi:diaminopropionate ammonia-lyase [Brevibacterium antiquum]|uniref:Diaminopropionate ammonia-lyase n=1 Tax=Brevibacterium antiquum TaxID=234835 RepID=A0A2H1IFM4_9MICO|nr:diaminopropionate ammonia-lyase [Brevibacterium antiquum]SMX73920.1 diaminopropionate ammonia-lyase [Brevibacterium antiquum]
MTREEHSLMTPDWFANARDSTWTVAETADDAYDFHRSLDAYAPTALVELPDLADELGVGHVFVKDESTRLGLPAFKALGASWAVHRALRAHMSRQVPTTLGRPAPAKAAIVTATDGNHGRAVARFARLAGRAATIYIPVGGIHPSAVVAIKDEGARIVEVAGDYDEAVAESARAAQQSGDVLVQDTAWDGYEEVPQWIVDGYLTLFKEIDAQLRERDRSQPDLVFVPTGVGSLLQGALAHYRSETTCPGTAVVSVEPETASCMIPSLSAGRAITVEASTTIMSGLNCPTPSSLAWPLVKNGLDAGVAVSDRDAIDAARRLLVLGIAAGPCGAAALAGARRALTGADADERRAHLGINTGSTVVLTITEGAGANPLPPEADHTTPVRPADRYP